LEISRPSTRLARARKHFRMNLMSLGGAVAKLKPIEIAAEIVASFVSNNSLPRAS